LLIPFSVSLNYGTNQTILCVAYAQLFKTLCIDLRLLLYSGRGVSFEESLGIDMSHLN
jgi:hypothetical protein